MTENPFRLVRTRKLIFDIAFNEKLKGKNQIEVVQVLVKFGVDRCAAEYFADDAFRRPCEKLRTVDGVSKFSY